MSYHDTKRFSQVSVCFFLLRIYRTDFHLFSFLCLSRQKLATLRLNSALDWCVLAEAHFQTAIQSNSIVYIARVSLH